MGNNLQCPYCSTDVPWGCTVCRGCQAEIKYEDQKGYKLDFLMWGLLLFGALIGWEMYSGFMAIVMTAVFGFVGFLLGFVVMWFVPIDTGKQEAVFYRNYHY
ncbi:MAG: hypothetical protein ACM3QW_01925 [Ignavibacteriales bacterium]